MSSFHNSQPVRENLTGWVTIASSDNDVEILEHRVAVDDFSQAVAIAAKLAPIVAQYEPQDSGYAIRVNLTRYVVEVRLSVPTGYWESEAQEKLVASITELFARS